MTGPVLHVAFAAVEGQYLLAVVDEFILLLEGPRNAHDSALDRLTPDPYPDDREASAEYRSGTREDLLDQRLVDARAVRTALEDFEPGRAVETPSGVEVPREELDAWLRTFSAIRLVLASRLGITHDDAPDLQDPRYGTYDWLGYRLEMLVQQAEQQDAS